MSPVIIFVVCFYTFDQDKTGFFSIDDLNSLINVVHNVKKDCTVQGNVKISWMKLVFEGDQIDFEQFSKISNAFPRLFEPAFKMQYQMITHWQGEVWWSLKKRAIQNFKDEADAKIRAIEEKKEKKKKNKKARKIQRNMGLLKYYCCPCFRKYYDPSLTAYDKMTDEEKAERDKQLALQRRQAELRIKNPETAPWIKYNKKIEEAEKMEDGPGYVETKVVGTERRREVRADARAERRKARNEDPDLRLKQRATVSGADIWLRFCGLVLKRVSEVDVVAFIASGVWYCEQCSIEWMSVICMR